mgnify:CR=1 FL=1
MAKIEAGCKLADFSFNTPFESDVKLSEKAKGAKKTILLFLRYYGCTLCQLDIREYANAYDRIKAKDAQLLVVLQSPASTINAQMKKEDLPFDIICDPDMGLYKEFELGVAASKPQELSVDFFPQHPLHRLGRKVKNRAAPFAVDLFYGRNARDLCLFFLVVAAQRQCPVQFYERFFKFFAAQAHYAARAFAREIFGIPNIIFANDTQLLGLNILRFDADIRRTPGPDNDFVLVAADIKAKHIAFLDFQDNIFQSVFSFVSVRIL